MTFTRWMMIGLTLLGIYVASKGTVIVAQESDQKVETAKPAEGKVEWTPLFNGKDLTNWKKSGFGGEGEVEVVDGSIVLFTGGGRISGITFTKEFPKTNFEIHLEARRAKGSDFFCGLTFPVAESHASLICGGWGGSVTGISNIDGNDASENSSSKYLKYENKIWYDIRLKVTPEKIEAWIDGKQEIDVELEGHRISTRIEIDRSKPLGISSFDSQSEIRKIEWREIKPEGKK